MGGRILLDEVAGFKEAVLVWFHGSCCVTEAKKSCLGKHTRWDFRTLNSVNIKLSGF